MMTLMDSFDSLQQAGMLHGQAEPEALPNSIAQGVDVQHGNTTGGSTR